jgi:tRNA(Ile)-lysidine synthase
VIQRVSKYVSERRLLQPGDRLAVACSGGADSVALLRILLELRLELGIVLSVAHFHHQIRGAEADADQQFVTGLAERFGLQLHLCTGDAPAFSRQKKISLETAARELRHAWFSELIQRQEVDKIATAHTLDDQAETVLMRILRGTGTRGLAGIAPEQSQKHLVRPLLAVRRPEIEAFLNGLHQDWRDDASNLDHSHARNRVRHVLLPLLEKEFNPAIRGTLADLAELAREEEAYWTGELASLIPELLHEGKPSRSGRTTSGDAAGVLALDLARLRRLPLAVQRQVLYRVAEKLGTALEFKHIQQLTSLIQSVRPGKGPVLPGGLAVSSSLRELRFSRSIDKTTGDETTGNYQYSLSIPGEVAVPELGSIFRAQIVSPQKPKSPEYNTGTFTETLLDRALLSPELTIRNWRPGDRYFSVHSHSPKKVKELLQTDHLGKEYSSRLRKSWPVIESAGQIVWMRGFPTPQAFAVRTGEAVLIEELALPTEAEE